MKKITKKQKQILKDICNYIAIGLAYVIALCSCSVTKATIKGANEGTTTTVTITTNNPVTTETTPTVELNRKDK